MSAARLVEHPAFTIFDPALRGRLEALDHFPQPSEFRSLLLTWLLVRAGSCSIAFRIFATGVSGSPSRVISRAATAGNGFRPAASAAAAANERDACSVVR